MVITTQDQEELDLMQQLEALIKVVVAEVLVELVVILPLTKVLMVVLEL